MKGQSSNPIRKMKRIQICNYLIGFFQPPLIYQMMSSVRLKGHFGFTFKRFFFLIMHPENNNCNTLVHFIIFILLSCLLLLCFLAYRKIPGNNWKQFWLIFSLGVISPFILLLIAYVIMLMF